MSISKPNRSIQLANDVLEGVPYLTGIDWNYSTLAYRVAILRTQTEDAIARARKAVALYQLYRFLRARSIPMLYRALQLDKLRTAETSIVRREALSLQNLSTAGRKDTADKSDETYNRIKLRFTSIL